MGKQKRNEGDEDAFLDSLKGADGEVDYSDLSLNRISGYTELLQNVNAALQNAKNAIIEDVVGEAVESVKSQYSEMMLEDIKEVKNMSDDDYITVVTEDGLRSFFSPKKWENKNCLNFNMMKLLIYRITTIKAYFINEKNFSQE